MANDATLFHKVSLFDANFLRSFISDQNSSVSNRSVGMVSSQASNTTEREWWAQRWIDVLESFGWRRRLERARNYVREGRVLQLTFTQTQVKALVQGTAPEPYEVSLGLDPFSEEQWHYVLEELSHRAIFAAKLLAGEMPQNIEEAFTASGLSLFPLSKFDIHSRCNCPDPVNPCKHIGAVYYLLGDYFSRDPFILFQLRGYSKAQVIDALNQLRTVEASAQHHLPVTSEFTPDQLRDRFWHYGAPLDPSLAVIVPAPGSHNVLEVLGAPPLETGTPRTAATEAATLKALSKMYDTIQQVGLMTAMMAQESGE
jgi:uncharacterized Zn finger protein